MENLKTYITSHSRYFDENPVSNSMLEPIWLFDD